MTDTADQQIEEFEQCLLPTDIFSNVTLETIDSDPIREPLSKKAKITADSRYVPYCKNDRFDTYGQHIANKLRTYTTKAEVIVEHLINNILFEADMGQYDAGVLPKK